MDLIGWRQGDVFLRAGDPWVVLSRSCDVVREASQVPAFYCAPLEQMSNDGEALSGRRPRYALVPDYGSGDWCADLGLIESLQKVDVQDAHPVHGCQSAEHERFFRRHVGRYFSKPSLADCVEKSCEKIAGRLRSKRNSGGAEEQLIRAIADVRVEVTPDIDPHDAETPREVSVVFVILRSKFPVSSEEVLQASQATYDSRDGLRGIQGEMHELALLWSESESDHDRVWVLTQYLETLAATAVACSPVVHIAHDVVAEDEYSFLRVKASVSLDVEHFSFVDDLSVDDDG